MKKMSVIIVMLFMMTQVFAQNATVVSAYNFHNSGRLDKAKEAIDKAITHEKTMVDAKTWFYRGNIYIDIHRSPIEEYRKLDPNAIDVAYEAYKRAMELDDKNRYSDDIRGFMPIIAESYFNRGAEMFNVGLLAVEDGDKEQAKNSFDGSASSFEKAFKIYSEAGISDTTSIYFISLAAELGEDWEKARTNLEKLIEMEYSQSGIYSSLANIYYNQDKDLTKAIEIYAIGRQLFPEDFNLLLNETNLFLGEDMTEEALSNLTKAAEIDTSNASIFFAIGAKYNELADDTTRSDELRMDYFEKSVSAYQRSIEIDSNYFDPNYNMGALYVNKAASIIAVANELPLNEVKKYDAMKAESDNYLNLSLPYLEKAHKIDSGDMATMVSLKEIYTRLGMNDKLKEMDEKIHAGDE
jgi:Tfp pilus assembly protein PilF